MSEIQKSLVTVAEEPNRDRDGLAEAWDSRVEHLLPRLPAWLGKTVAWLRQPSHRIVRLLAGVGFVLGGCLAILPVFGVWMFPLGFALLGEDYPPLKGLLERCARWGEKRWERLRHRFSSGTARS